MPGEANADDDGGYISHPNTRRLHRGNREEGAECGQQSDGGWAVVEAENPLDAVMTYGTPTCSKCFRHAAGLMRVLQKEHRPQVVHADLSEMVERLPWSLDTEDDEVAPDAR